MKEKCKGFFPVFTDGLIYPAEPERYLVIPDDSRYSSEA